MTDVSKKLKTVAQFDRQYVLRSPDGTPADLSSEEASNRRMRLLRDRWHAIVTVGSEKSKIKQYEHLIELGVRLLLVDAEDSDVARQLVARNPNSCHHVVVPMESRSSLVSECVDAIEKTVRELESKGILPTQEGNLVNGLLSAIWTPWDDGVMLASRVAVTMGTNHDPPSVTDLVHDKFASRKFLFDAGLTEVTNHLIATVEDAEALELRRFPVVVKPVHGAASIGVTFSDTRDELIANVKTTFEHMKQIYRDAELMGLVFDDSKTTCTKKEDLCKLTVEDYIDGPEYDVDVVFVDGEAVYFGVGQDWQTKKGWFCERGMHHPASLDDETYNAVGQTAVMFAKALGCRIGVYHIEVKVSKRFGAQILEVNPRMGGGPVWNFHRSAWGVDLIAEAAFAFMGIPSAPRKASKPQNFVSCLLVFAEESGTLREDMLEANEAMRSHEFTDELSLPFRSGEQIVGWVNDTNTFPTHLGKAIFSIPASKMSALDAIEWTKSQRQRILIPYEEKDHYDLTKDEV